MGITDLVRDAVAGDGDRLVAIFKDIHQHPELGFAEERTAGIVARELTALGFDVATGVGGTGVVGVLRNGPGPTVMYRADMDANAVEEATGLPYASTARTTRADGVEVPVGHLCGHDAHTTWLLGAARALVDLKREWSGTLVLVGQPAEELGEGAAAMVADGLYGRHGTPVPDALLALHTAPGPTGYVAAIGGVRMAGCDQLDVRFRGVGGHGSMPHLTKDPVLMAALAVVEYQAVVARVVDPLEMAVLTVGAIQAGADNNVIPEDALLKLNLRFFTPATRERLLAGIRSISEGIARTYGMPDDRLPEITMKGHAPPLVNDPALIARLNGPLRDLLGANRVVTEFPPATGSEDAQVLVAGHPGVPVAYLFVGTAEPEEFARARAAGQPFPYLPHNPNYRVDLAAIPLGATIGAVGTLELLARPAPAAPAG